MIKMKNKYTILLLFVSIYYSNIYSQTSEHKLWQDGMVLQREKTIPLQGKAIPNTKVTVQFRGQEYSSDVSLDSSWQVNLNSGAAGGPFDMQITGNEGHTIRNILVGDVWLCSGQSNMELTLARLKDTYPEVFEGEGHSEIRQFTVPQTYNFQGPVFNIPGGNWIEAKPEKIDKFSGVAYFFAEKVYKETGVPIGIILNALGGSPAQAWISEDGLKKFPTYLEEHYTFRNPVYMDSIVAYNNSLHQDWFQSINQIDQGFKEKWWKTNVVRKDWHTIEMPSKWKEAGFNVPPGSIWLHKTFSIPNSKKGKSARLFLGCIVDADSVYVNGHFVGTTSYQYPPRKYEVPAEYLKVGNNEITIRVLDQNGHGGFVREKTYALLYEDGSSISLEGPWLWKAGGAVPAIKPQVFIRWKSGGLYNSLQHPLFSFPVKGVLWYQGESNTRKPSEYFDLMSVLIHDWRNGYGDAQLPFYYVQLASFMEKKDEPVESAWAELRQQQLNMLQISNTGMAVAIDIGEWNDIHPLNKKDVGQRLARIALHRDYGNKNLEYSGPIVRKVKRKNDTIMISFDHAENGFMPQEKFTYFELAGSDKKFVKAQAVSNGNRIFVTSQKIPKPVFIRYAWADNPEGANVFNKEGLPASPFEMKVE